jgi:formate-dependent nitrite reductase membrane component NrfD
MQNKFSNPKVQSIMESFGGIQSAVAPDYFYTRLKGKMQREEEKKAIFIFRPAFITAALSLFLIVNIFSLISIRKAPEERASVQNNKPASIESFAAAYNMNTGSVYE